MILARDSALKETAQRAFVSYAKSVFLMKNKKVFNVQALNTDAFALSLGLVNAPRIRFLQRMNANNSSNAESLSKKTYFHDQSESEHENDTPKLEFYDSDVSEDNVQTVNSVENKVPFECPNDSDNDDTMIKIKRKNHDEIEPLSQNEVSEMNNCMKPHKKKVLTKAAVVKMALKKNIVPNKKIIFDDEGEAVQATKGKRSELAQEYENEPEGMDIELAKKVLREEDKFDKQLFKEKVKAKHKAAKMKLKEKRRAEQKEKDDFGTDSEEEPDLSWLPDPDKIYGKKSSEEEEMQDINNKIDDTFSNKFINEDEQDLPPATTSSNT